jgi:hypothetical protein
MKIQKIRYICSTIIICCAFMTSAFVMAQEATEEQAVSGRELLADCEPGSTTTSPNQACMKYVFGLVQTVVMLQQMDPSKKLFCIDPNAVSLEAVTSGVTAWLKAVPNRLDEDAYILVSEALNSSYPCSQVETI